MKELKNLTPFNETLSTLYFFSVNGDIQFPKETNSPMDFSGDEAMSSVWQLKTLINHYLPSSNFTGSASYFDEDV